MQSNQSQPTPSSLAIWAALVSVYIVWGSTYLAIRFAVQTMPPFLMAGVRFLIAGGVLYAWRRLKGDPAPTKIEWRSATIIGLCLLLSGNGGVVWAGRRVDSGVSALLVGSTPLWMALLDALRPRGQKPSASTMMGIVIGFCGIALLIGPAQLAGGAGRVDLLGALVVLWAAFSWAAGSLYSRKARLPSSPLLGTSMEMLTGGAALLLFSVLVGDAQELNMGAIAPASWLGLVYLIVFGAWVGFSAYTWLLRVAPTPLVSTYAYVNPVVAVVLGYLFAAEPLSVRSILATVIIVSAVGLTTRRSAPRRAVPPSTTGLGVVPSPASVELTVPIKEECSR